MKLPMRNVAIIAHVDHGKTTLIDGLLRETGTFQEHEQLVERVMDSMELERERGITIKAKNASIFYGDHKINIVDTPGHADFGGEVERTLMMVEGVLLLVDAAEGCLPQTRFVLQKALALGLTPIVIINKVDRKDARIADVRNEIYDLFIDLDANEEQIDFPVIYASAKEGRATLEEGEPGNSLKPILDTIIKTIPAPKDNQTGLQGLICNIAYSPYLGSLGICKLYSGQIKSQQVVNVVQATGKRTNFKAIGLRSYNGLEEVNAEELFAGDIAIVAGFPDIAIGDSICENDQIAPLPRIQIDPPTVSAYFSVNTSPLAGKDGNYLTSRKLYERLLAEARSNVAIQVIETDKPEVFEVKGRGELQLCIIAEQIRREGGEFMMSRPHIVLKEEDGVQLEPVEYVVLDIPEGSMGSITETLSKRKGLMKKMQHLSAGRVRLEFRIPSRGLIGYRSKFLTDTRGEGLISSYFDGYEAFSGSQFTRANGALIADRTGVTTAYALNQLEERGKLFVKPQVEVYEGMVIGEQHHQNDLNVNAVKEKKLTNMRSAGKDDNVVLTPVPEMSIDKCISWIDEDEWVEITPSFLRMRKHVLPANQRSLIRR